LNAVSKTRPFVRIRRECRGDTRLRKHKGVCVMRDTAVERQIVNGRAIAVDRAVTELVIQIVPSTLVVDMKCQIIDICRKNALYGKLVEHQVALIKIAD